MKKILVATDFSACATNAMEYAMDLARVLGVEVVALHAIGAFEWKITSEFPHWKGHMRAFREPAASDPRSVVVRDGRPMGTMLCHHIRFHFVLSHYLPTSLDSICEIGGGYGSLARV